MTEPIRVLHVLQRMEAGGTQALLMNLYRNIDRTKIQFDFFVEYPDKQFYDDEIIRLGGRIFYTNFKGNYNLGKYIRSFKQILRNHPEYRIVHVHTYSIGFFILKAAKKCGVPIRIAHSHSNQAVHNALLPAKLLLQRLYTIDATDLMAASQEAGEYLFRKKHFLILKNAIDSRAFVANNKDREKLRNVLGVNDRLVLGHVGRFQPEKNHSFLIDVFAKVKKIEPTAVLILVGSGPLEADVKHKVSSLGLSKDVIFMGNRRDMSKVYQAMDVFVFPSEYEGFGISAIEAQAAGIPIVVSGGLPPETNVTPLFDQIDLSEGTDAWTREILKQSSRKDAHQDMHSYIEDAGLDMKKVASEMSHYYKQKASVADSN